MKNDRVFFSVLICLFALGAFVLLPLTESSVDAAEGCKQEQPKRIVSFSVSGSSVLALDDEKVVWEYKRSCRNWRPY